MLDKHCSFPVAYISVTVILTYKTMSVPRLKADWILPGGMERQEELSEPCEERCSGEMLIWNLEPNFPHLGRKIQIIVHLCDIQGGI